MVYRPGDNAHIDAIKARFKLEGDVYVVNDVMQSLTSHKWLFPESEATTIEEAEQEYIQYLEDERRRAEEATAQTEPEPQPITEDDSTEEVEDDDRVDDVETTDEVEIDG